MKRLTVAALALSSLFAANLKAEEVGLLWFGKSGMATRVMTGFNKELKAKAPDIKVEFKINQKDEAAAIPIYQKFSETKDAIVFLRSSGAKAAAKTPSKVPVFIGAANNPQALGVVKEMAAPEGYITGVTYYLPAMKQLEIFKKIFPDMKSLGIIVQGSHPSAPIDTAETKAACEELGIAYQEVACETKTDALKAAKKLSGNVDLIVIGNQAVIMDSAKQILAVALGSKTPVVSYSEKPIKSAGSICGLAPDDAKLGALLAQSLIDVLKNGKKVSEVPVKTDPEPKFLVNEKVLKKFGITIPEELKATATFVK